MSARSVKNVIMCKTDYIRLFAACGHNELCPYHGVFLYRTHFILCKDSANERNVSLLTNSRVQLILCKDNANERKESLLSVSRVQLILCKDSAKILVMLTERRKHFTFRLLAFQRPPSERSHFVVRLAVVRWLIDFVVVERLVMVVTMLISAVPTHACHACYEACCNELILNVL